jgi:hypothetical protein
LFFDRQKAWELQEEKKSEPIVVRFVAWGSFWNMQAIQKLDDTNLKTGRRNRICT